MHLNYRSKCRCDSERSINGHLRRKSAAFLEVIGQVRSYWSLGICVVFASLYSITGEEHTVYEAMKGPQK